MKIEKVRNNKKLIAYVFLGIDSFFINNPGKFIEHLVKDIPASSIGYAGFKKREYLKKHLEWQVFGSEKKIKKFNLNRREVLSITAKTLKKCHGVISSKPTKVFIFPTFNPFIINKMSGVAGYCPWENTVLLYLYPKKDWRQNLKSAICHEFNHSVVAKHHKRKTLLDNIIIEGLAENFREYAYGGKIASWSRTLSLKECKKTFLRIKRLLNSKNRRVYYSVFFEDKEYSLWTGYSIGYQIVKSFLRNNKNLTWKEIVKLNPKEILKKSGF